jgi:hypothetical protein
MNSSESFYHLQPFRAIGALNLDSCGRRIMVLALALCCVAARNCHAQNSENGGRTQCDARQAQVLIGQQLTSLLVESARTLSGSRLVRRLGPDSIPTMDHRSDRVNIVFDSNGIVTAVTCG